VPSTTEPSFRLPPSVRTPVAVANPKKLGPIQREIVPQACWPVAPQSVALFVI
jgi:hypothetical protein